MKRNKENCFSPFKKRKGISFVENHDVFHEKQKEQFIC